MKLDLALEGITCLDCAHRLEEALRAVPGVQRAEVCYPTRLGSVTGSDSLAVEDLLRAVEQAGYQAQIVGDGAPAAARPAAAATAGEPAVPRVPAGGEARHDYDLVIVGTGGAGMAAAIRASELGARAALVEGNHVVGGTCVNVGCIPSKNLIEAAAHYHSARKGFPGILAAEPELAWKEVLEQKRQIVERLRQEKYLNVLEAYEGVSLLRGRAELLGGPRVRVGEREVKARKVVLATGTRPAMPPIPGLDAMSALDSTTAMQLEALPASMIVIGGGAIGLELAQAFARFGVRVVVLEAMERILPAEDAEVSEALRKALEAEGIEIHTSVRVTGISEGVTRNTSERSISNDSRDVSRDDSQRSIRDGSQPSSDDSQPGISDDARRRIGNDSQREVGEGSTAGIGYEVLLEERGGRRAIHAEQLLVATGRRPNTEQLGLEAVGAETDPKGFIKVDASLRTSAPDVFAAGDVTGAPGFVYIAALQGRVAAEAALGGIGTGAAVPVDLTAMVIPRVTFTDPQVAAVGLTEREAWQAGFVPEVASLPVELVPRAVASHRRSGRIKLVAEAGTSRLLGAHMLAPHAGDVIGEAVLAVRFGLTTSDLVSTLHPYLTWGEGLKLAAQAFTTDVAKLSCCA